MTAEERKRVVTHDNKRCEMFRNSETLSSNTHQNKKTKWMGKKNETYVKDTNIASRGEVQEHDDDDDSESDSERL